jgi:hypothetical protein
MKEEVEVKEEVDNKEENNNFLEEMMVMKIENSIDQE